MLPLGVVPTRPLWLEASSNQMVLAMGPEGRSDPVVFGSSHHHPVLVAASNLLVCYEVLVGLRTFESESFFYIE